MTPSGSKKRVVATDSGHALDFDDYTYAYPAHPSGVLVPAVLALCSEVGATGEEAIGAYVAGFEAFCYLVAPIDSTHYERGWHASSTLGTFTATAASSSLLDLDAERTGHALNIAASRPAGLRRNIGTMTKPMHAGEAARSGVVTATLGADGLTAEARALSEPTGFLDAYCGLETVDANAFPDLGAEWHLHTEGGYLKKFPSCGATQTTIEGTIDLLDEKDVDAAEVVGIEVTVALDQRARSRAAERLASLRTQPSIADVTAGL
jgi:2-methylcitrate dehydratase PrpD